MGKRKRQRKTRAEYSLRKFGSFKSPEGIKADFLKNLYRFLNSLLLAEQGNIQCALADSRDLNKVKVCHEGVKFTFGDALVLSDVLFREVERRFEEMFSRLLVDDPDKDSHLTDAMEVMTLLFRCCMLLLILLEACKNHTLEKGLVLLRLLKKSISLKTSENGSGKAHGFESSSERKSDNGVFGSSVKDFTASLQFLEPSPPVSSVKSAILETFIDELMAHGCLKGYFKFINSIASFDERLFIPHYSLCDTAVLVEALCRHFLESFSGERGVEEILSQLFCFHAKELNYPLGAPSLSVTSAVPLILSPIMASAPKYLQFHVSSLVSDALDVEITKPDRKLVNCFLSTFERSVTLYVKHMYTLQPDGFTPLLKTGWFTSGSFENDSQLQFRSYVSREMKNQIDIVVAKLGSCSSDSGMSGNFFELKSDMVCSCLRFVKESRDFCGSQFQDQVIAILSYLVLKASETFGEESVLPVEGETLYHLCLVSSLLKLMSSSLLQAVRSLRNGAGDDSAVKGFSSSCKEFDFILGAVEPFGSLDASLPLQRILSSVMVGDRVSRHEGSKSLFLHFSGLLSVSFASGLGCLAKGCLLTLQAVLNLFVLEDGGIEPIESMIDSLKVISPSKSSVVNIRETLYGQNSSIVSIAAKIQKTRSRKSSRKNGVESLSSPDGVEEETEETCNGELFLKCLLKKKEKASSIDDIVDFIECKQGRDYSEWLKNRARYRTRKYEKMAVLRWKERKQTWKMV
ncbi:hypothetical protein M569_15491 [Genlisea aurea]|uniref:DUF7812 domain-containing protein n=1 Tax=Genlisea aurea TaxID=192259 RepID=S8BY25_9LAMI|nr:hypothetical protein M569_15491 [Genlisea aurea]